jgi:hypothetical protein
MINGHADAGFLQGEGCRAICNIAAQSQPAKDVVNSLQGFQLVLQAQKRSEYDPNFWNGRFEMKRLQPGNELMVNFQGKGRWVSASVSESYTNGTYDVN